jgi:hypothetical protein
MKTSLLFLTLFICGVNLAQTDLYFIFNNSEFQNQSDEEIIVSSNKLIDKESKYASFTIKNLAPNGKKQSLNKTIDKREFNYYSLGFNCDFSFCDYLKNELNSLKKDGYTKVYFFHDVENLCPSSINVNGVEVEFLQDESWFKKRILANGKSSKKNKFAVVCYLTFGNGYKTGKPEVFIEEALKVTEGKSLVLEPKIIGEYKTIKWSPGENLSCTDCLNPSFSGTKNTELSVEVSNQLGCVSKAVTKISVLEGCKMFNEAQIKFNSIAYEKYVHMKALSPTSKYDWQVISNSAGDLVFDLITAKNCGEWFVLKVMKDNTVLYEKRYERQDITKKPNSGETNSLYNSFPDAFVFRLMLSKMPNAEEMIDFPLRISIESFDNDNNQYKKYVSPTIRFTKCN